ncbi:MAG TPA: response regulator, partial [Acidobacteriota bacterium]
MSSRLLLVTDEEKTREAISAEVAGLGAEVVHARDGEQALQLLSQRPVDGVITGLRLRGMDGLTLLKRIQETN